MRAGATDVNVCSSSSFTLPSSTLHRFFSCQLRLKLLTRIYNGSLRLFSTPFTPRSVHSITSSNRSTPSTLLSLFSISLFFHSLVNSEPTATTQNVSSQSLRHYPSGKSRHQSFSYSHRSCTSPAFVGSEFVYALDFHLSSVKRPDSCTMVQLLQPQSLVVTRDEAGSIPPARECDLGVQVKP